MKSVPVFQKKSVILQNQPVARHPVACLSQILEGRWERHSDVGYKIADSCVKVYQNLDS